MNETVPEPSTPSQTKPRIEVLGVYSPFIRKSVYKRQSRVTASDEDTAAHFKDLVLVEALLHQPDGKLDMSEIGQTYLQGPEHKYPDNFQVPWDEALLSSDGTLVIQRESGCVHGSGTLRFAFYLHFYDPKRPLETPYGPVECPAIEAAPKRLMRLVPYNACL